MECDLASISAQLGHVLSAKSIDVLLQAAGQLRSAGQHVQGSSLRQVASNVPLLHRDLVLLANAANPIKGLI